MGSVLQAAENSQMCLLFSDVHIPYQTPEMDGMYKGLSIFTLSFLPNTPLLIQSWASEAPKNSSNRLLILESTMVSSQSSLFLENIGSVISLLILILVIYPIIILFSMKFETFKKIRSYFEWNGFFMVILFNYYAFMHAAFLQLRQFSVYKGAYYDINCCLAIIAIVKKKYI